MAKVLTPEQLRKANERKEKEIKKWEKQKARPKGNTYFWYLVLIIALIYAVDEIASQINSLMQTEIANDFIKSESSVLSSYISKSMSAVLFLHIKKV